MFVDGIVKTSQMLKHLGKKLEKLNFTLMSDGCLLRFVAEEGWEWGEKKIQEKKARNRVWEKKTGTDFPFLAICQSFSPQTMSLDYQDSLDLFCKEKLSLDELDDLDLLVADATSAAPPQPPPPLLPSSPARKRACLADDARKENSSKTDTTSPYHALTPEMSLWAQQTLQTIRAHFPLGDDPDLEMILSFCGEEYLEAPNK